MNFTAADVEELKAILALSKMVGIEGIVLADGKVMGGSSNKKVGLVSPTTLSIDPTVKVGIGRPAELEKRLAIFNGPVVMSGEVGRTGEISRLTMAAGRTKAQFRCSATSMVIHLKENVDVPMVVVTVSKEEAGTLVKAAKTFGAETIVFKISSGGDVHIECVDSTNDQFTTGTERPAEYLDEAETVLFTYQAVHLTTILDVGTRDADTLDLVFGQAGSITALVKGHTVLLAPNYNED
jgi:hypothetical protein